MSKPENSMNSTNCSAKGVQANAQFDVQSAAQAIAQSIAESGQSTQPDVQTIAQAITHAMSAQTKNSSPDWMEAEPGAKRTIKDTVFTHMFRDKEYILQLFKALHPEATDVTEDDITCLTLEPILTENIYSDLGLLVRNKHLILVEAQSKWSVNIVFRANVYLMETWWKYIKETKRDKYNAKPPRLPYPELYVIYTGDKPIDKEYIDMSEVLIGMNESGKTYRPYGFPVRVLTTGQHGTSGEPNGVSGGEPGSDSEPGDIIYQYVTFSKVIDDQKAIYGPTVKAVREAIRICKDRKILVKYLTEHEQEVQNIMIALFDRQSQMEELVESKLAEGEQIGMAKGAEQKAIEIAEKRFRKGDTVEEVAELTGLSISTAKSIKEQMLSKTT